MPPFGSLTETHHTDRDHSDDGLNSNLVGVTIHNLSQGGTVLEQSDHSDESDRPHYIGAADLINTAASRLSLYNRYRPHGVNHTDVDDDDIISHSRNCYLGANDYEGNRYITPEHSPHDHVNFDYAAPSETSQQARDRLLNHNDKLADENQKLRCQLQ
jgi:hypothetical protein